MCDNSAWITRPNPWSTFRILGLTPSIFLYWSRPHWTPGCDTFQSTTGTLRFIREKTFFHTDCDPDPFDPFDPIRRQVRAEKRLRESAEERSARLLREVPGSPAIDRSTRHVYFLGLLKILSDYQIIIILGLFRSCPLHRIYIVFRLFRSSRCSYGLNIQVWWWTLECAEIYMGLPGTSAKFSQKR